MKARRLPLCLALWALCCAGASAGLQVSGYVKSYAVAQDSIAGPVFHAGRSYQSQNALRLMAEAFGERSAFELHYEASPVFVSRALARPAATFRAPGDSYRLADIRPRFDDKQPDQSQTGKNQTYQNLDRLSIQWRLAKGDLTLGRQAIAFGSARIINPTDIFLPYDVRTFNTEYRQGVDGIRWARQLGAAGELDLGLALGKDASDETSAAFLQLRGNRAGMDLQLALIAYAKQRLAGAGMEAALGDAGFWLEVAAVDGIENYVRLSTGLDHAFTAKLYGLVEYHYSSAGGRQPGEYPALAASLPWQRGGLFLLGRNYLMPGLSIQASPLWSLGSQAIMNLDDDSAFVSLTAEFHAAQNLYLDFGYYHFIGEDLSLAPTGLPQVESEYGASPDTFYASLRWYF